MYDTLPDVAVDERVPMLFAAGFSLILLVLIVILVLVAILANRARKAGIYRKYVVADDRPACRRTIGPR